MTEKETNIRRDVLWRVTVLYVIMAIFAIAILYKVLYIQFAEGDIWKEKSIKTTLKNIIIEPNRGDICAIDGRLLSSSVPYYEIRMDFGCEGLTEQIFKDKVDSLAYLLSGIFPNKNKAQYLNDLKNAYDKKNRYFLIKRNITYQQLKKIKEFPIFRLGKYEGGLIVSQEYKRVKPFQNLASRTIGHLNKDESTTRVGLEGAYDRYLRGVRGYRLMQKISGNAWKPVDDGNEVEPVDGLTLITTLDINIQDVAENALMKQLSEHDADHGCAILMEVETGEVKAIANLTKTSDGRYIEDYNYAIGESVEPGSTFKLASLIVALEDGMIELDDSIETGNGVVRYYDLTMKDTKSHGTISVQEAFEMSSNVGISKIIVKNYKSQPEKFVDRLYGMNLHEKLNIEIKGEEKPLIKYPGDPMWSGVSLPQMSIGYEVKLTPLQILSFYNAIANNGKMVRPKFAKYLRYHGDTLKEFQTEVINPSICSSQTLQKVHIMLEGVVERGTARNIKNTQYKIAGKTGTAQIAQGKSGYGQKKVYLASFVGYFPAEKPKYSCIVVVNSPSNDVYYGNLVAGPVFKEIADKVYSTNLKLHEPMKIPAMIADPPLCKNTMKEDLVSLLNSLNINSIKDNCKESWVKTFLQDSTIYLTDNRVSINTVPSVKGMSLKDALFILENKGLVVKVSGRGKVVKQSPPEGTYYRKGNEILIELS
jgi:cell division protein FtsI (penicillin-binding protein 3)